MAQFHEAKKKDDDKGQSNSTQKAIVDIAQAMASVFKRYNRQTRQRAAKKLCTSDGRRAVDQLAQNPNRPLNQFPKLAFREWFENSNDDWVNQARFDDYMLKQKFSDLISSFPEITFLYDEKQDVISFFYPITFDYVDYKEVTKVLKNVFGNNLILNKTDLFSPQEKPQMVQTTIDLPGDFEYPKVNFSNDAATGYWELESHISNASERPRAQLKNVIMDFKIKSSKAADIAEDLSS